jgi:hypothetical protein
VTSDLLELAFDPTVTDDTRTLIELCERCRRRRLQRNIFAAVYEGKE